MTVNQWKRRFSELPAGLTLKSLADKWGVAYVTIYIWAKRFGYDHADTRGAKHRARTRDRYGKVDWNRRVSDIAREIGVSKQAVHEMKGKIRAKGK